MLFVESENNNMEKIKALEKEEYTLAPFALILQKELVRRCKQNSNYSLRSFAKYLGISASLLSQVLTGKRSLSSKKQRELSERLQLNPNIQKVYTEALLLNLSEDKKEDVFSLDEFEYISEWYHIALLSLLQMPKELKTPETLAKRLGIHVVQVRDALERLVRLKLIKKDSDNNYSHVRSEIRFRNKTSSKGSIQYNLQLIEKAKKCILEESFDQRAASAVYVETTQSSVEALREEIRIFRNYISEKYSKPDTAEDVYCLSVQFFSTTKK